MAEIEQRRRGQPTKYKPCFCERVIEMGKKGKSPAQMASALGVARTTLISWRGQYEDFNTAMALAMTHSQAAWEQIGYDSLHDRTFQGAAYTKLMQARFRHDYTERQELTGADGAPLMRPTTIQLIGVNPEPRDDNTRNLIDIQGNQPFEAEALLEPEVSDEFVAPTCLDQGSTLRRSEAELLTLYATNPAMAEELSPAEDKILTRAIMREANDKRQAAERAEQERIAKRAQQRLMLPSGIGGKRLGWVKRQYPHYLEF